MTWFRCVYCGLFVTDNRFRNPKKYASKIMFATNHGVHVVCSDCENDIENFWRRKLNTLLESG